MSESNKCPNCGRLFKNLFGVKLHLHKMILNAQRNKEFEEANILYKYLLNVNEELSRK